jgi:5'-nucleotidase
MNMPKWTKIYFDLDNTLFSYEYAFEKAIQDCYQDLVNEWQAQATRFPHIPVEDWFDVFKYFRDAYWPRYERKELTQRDYRRERYLATMKHFDLPAREEEADLFHDRYYDQAIHYVRPYPGLYSLLHLLKDKGIETGIITNGKTDVHMAKYQKLMLRYVIPDEHVYISEQVGLKKPDRALFQKVLGNARPELAMFIGDTWEHDVVGALDAGWDAIFLNTQNRHRSTKHKPLVELHHFIELLQFLKSRFK